MKARSVVFSFLFFLTMIIPVSARSCVERLDVLENVVQNLIENLQNKFNENVDPNQSAEEAFKTHILEIERHGLEQKLENLEISLSRANRRIQELEAKVSEFELSKVLMKTSPSTDNSKKNKLLTGLGKIKSTMEYSWAGTTAPVLQKISVKNGLKEIQSNHSMAAGKLETSEETKGTLKGKRALAGIHSIKTSSVGGVAFSAYVSAYETELAKDLTIKFDTIVSNIGNHYNKHLGMFITPEHGVYVFSWTLHCRSSNGYIYTQLVVNSNVVGAMYTNCMSTTEIVVVQANAGDMVYVRTHPSNGHGSNLFSNPDWRSSFSGWKLL